MALGVIPVKGAVDMTANRGTNAANGVNPQDFATVAQLGGMAADLSWKNPVRVATIVAGTLATDFEAGDTVDGVVLVLNDRILIQNQASAIENGIYVVQAAGAPVRATDFSATTPDTSASAVKCAEGTVNAELEFIVTTTGDPVPGTDANNWALYPNAVFKGANQGIVVGTNNVATDLINLNIAIAALATPTTTARGEILLYGRFALGTTPFDLADFITFRALGASFDLNGTNVTGAFFRGAETDFVGTGGASLTRTSGTSTDGFFGGRDITGLSVVTWDGPAIRNDITGAAQEVDFANGTTSFQPSASDQLMRLVAPPDLQIVGSGNVVEVTDARSLTLTGNENLLDGSVSLAAGVLTLTGLDCHARVAFVADASISMTGLRGHVNASIRVDLDAFTCSNTGCAARIRCANLGTTTAIDISAAVGGSFDIRDSAGVGGFNQTLPLGLQNTVLLNLIMPKKVTVGTTTDTSKDSQLDLELLGDGTATAVTVVGHATFGVQECRLNLKLGGAGSTVTIQDLAKGNTIHIWSDTAPVVGATAATENEITFHNTATGQIFFLGTNRVVPTVSDKGLVALVTSADGDQATSSTVTTTPVSNGDVGFRVNGLHYLVGDGVKTTPCYFSGDGGTTARAIADIVAADTSHWNGSLASPPFELAVTDRIDYVYNG